MNLKSKILATAAAAALAIGLGGGVSAQDDTTQVLSVAVALDTTLGILDYHFVDSETAASFGTANITALSGATKTGAVTVYLVDARLAPANTGFELTVKIDDPFTSGSNTFPASSAELVTTAVPPITLVTSATYPSSGVSLNGVSPVNSTGSLASPGLAILEGESGVNVQLNQFLGLEVNVPANTPIGTYTTTLILTGVGTATP